MAITKIHIDYIDRPEGSMPTGENMLVSINGNHIPFLKSISIRCDMDVEGGLVRVDLSMYAEVSGDLAAIVKGQLDEIEH